MLHCVGPEMMNLRMWMTEKPAGELDGSDAMTERVHCVNLTIVDLVAYLDHWKL